MKSNAKRLFGSDRQLGMQQPEQQQKFKEISDKTEEYRFKIQ